MNKTKLHFVFALIAVVLFSYCETNKNNDNTQAEKRPAYVILVHGGAGNISRQNMPEEKIAEISKAIQQAIAKGAEVLEGGGSGIDAVEQTIRILEDNPLFNAGKGAVYTSNGICELDASIMEGKTLNAGAIAGVSNIKNPITAARAVMEKSEHVMLISNGALQFAKENNIETVDSSYFSTDRRLKQYLKRKEKDADLYETVGCVVLDKDGNLFAGTSTGGVFYKKYGRVGDSPIIGAGTYASNNSCAVSCTGKGEFFIRYSIAHNLSALVEYKKADIQKAADYLIHEKLKKIDASGGLIAIDKHGKIAVSFNTSGMIRGYKKAGEEIVVALF